MVRGAVLLLLSAGCAVGSDDRTPPVWVGDESSTSGSGLSIGDDSTPPPSDDSSSEDEGSTSFDPPSTTTDPVTPDVPDTCLPATDPCTTESECCVADGYTCGTTTLGQVCCGNEGAACSTPNGEDCCGDLLCVAGQCLPAGVMPPFHAPFACGESWTYSHHSAEVRRALDFINNSGATDNAPALAAAAGVATHHYEEGGAGNYIVVDHWGGWTTYYFHLQSFSVDDGAWVVAGDEVGRVGSTGASSGPHLHFEELYNGAGEDIVLEGQALSYPGSYGQASITSENCPDSP